LENQKSESDKLNQNKIKDEIIKIFKEEKMDVTNILQKELKEQVMILNKEMVIFLFFIFFAYRKNLRIKILHNKKRLMIMVKR
jgi:hypothetical protein